MVPPSAAPIAIGDLLTGDVADTQWSTFAPARGIHGGPVATMVRSPEPCPVSPEPCSGVIACTSPEPCPVSPEPCSGVIACTSPEPCPVSPEPCSGIQACK